MKIFCSIACFKTGQYLTLFFTGQYTGWKCGWYVHVVLRSVIEYYLFAALCPIELKAQLVREAVKLKFQMATVPVRCGLGILPHVSGPYIDGLVQERCNSNALSMELHLSCTVMWVIYSHSIYERNFMNGTLSMLMHIHIMGSCLFSAKPLTKPILTSYQKYSAAFTWEQIHKMCSLTGKNIEGLKQNIDSITIPKRPFFF